MEKEQQLLKFYRRKPLCNPADMPTQCNYARSAIECIIPHRDPFLFIDRITGLDLSEKIVVGEYDLLPDFPAFKGHFPGYPIYPGSLQLEAVGQLGLTLAHFITNNTTTIDSHAKQPAIRATRIGGAFYREEILPGNTMLMLAKVVESDDYFSIILGQTLVNDKVASVAILEVAFVE